MQAFVDTGVRGSFWRTPCRTEVGKRETKDSPEFVIACLWKHKKHYQACTVQRYNWRASNHSLVYLAIVCYMQSKASQQALAAHLYARNVTLSMLRRLKLSYLSQSPSFNVYTSNPPPMGSVVVWVAPVALELCTEHCSQSITHPQKVTRHGAI